MSANHQTDLIPVEELRGLFEGRRPDPEAFRAGVEQRIAERERESERVDNEHKEGNGGLAFMRRAAAVLPIDPVSGGKLGSSGLKLMYATLALPALVMVSTFGGFLVSARALKSEMRAAPLPGDKPVAWPKFTRMTLNRDLQVGGRLMLVVQSGTLLALFLSFLTGGRTAIDALTLVLLVGMGSVVVTVRGLAQAGLLSRRVAAQLAFSLLMTVFTGCFLWLSTVLSISDGHAVLGVGWAAGATLCGIVASTYMGWGARRGGAALSLAVFLVIVFNPLALTKSSPAALRSQLAGMELDPESLSAWEGAAALHVALDSVGAELPDMSPTAARVQRAIEDGVDAHPVVWTAAARMRLIDDVHWELLAQRTYQARLLDQLLEPGLPFNTTNYYEYLIPMLVATRDLSEAERDQVAAKALAAWPSDGEYDPLADLAMLAHGLDQLGLGHLLEPRRELIHQLLQSHWVAPGTSNFFSDGGGFTPDPVKFETSFVTETWDAVQLMSRVGLPEGVDPRWIRGYLKNESRCMPLIFEALPTHKAMPRAALLRLERELGLGQRSWLAALLAERLLIATVLLVALCLMAIRLAPRGTGETAQGALP